VKRLFKRNPALLAVFVFCLLVALLAPAAAFAGSSYTSWLWFDQYQQGISRYYSGTNMHFEANVVPIPPGITLSWSMALYRDGTWSDTKIGSTRYYTCPSTVSPDWYTGQSGNYFFRFYSIDDGLSVYDDEVRMWSN
jgi:hypothetical protein